MYRIWCLLVLGVLFLHSSLPMQAEVASTRNKPSTLKKVLLEIADAHSDLVTIEEFADDGLGNSLLWITLGLGENVHTRPAMVLVGGIEPMDVTGPEVMSGIVSSFLVSRTLNNDRILDSVTVYVVPYLSPSSLETLFNSPDEEVFGSLHPHDADRDGLVDEDGGEDIDGDGRILWLRKRSSSGNFVEHHLAPEIMVPYELGVKGQRYDVYLEGIDSDNDGKLNEDVVGAVNLNKNAPHQYPAYTDYAGDWSMTAPELRALTEKVFSRPNIIGAYVLGTYDNIKSDWKFDARRNPRSANLLSTDSSAYASLRTELAGDAPFVLKGAPAGDLGSWLAYGVGPITMIAPTYVYLAMPQDSSLETSSDPEVLAYRWLRKHKSKAIKGWESTEHNFFDSEVEVGGVVAWDMVNAPADSLQAVTEKHYTFVRTMCDHMPKLSVEHAVVDLGADMYRIELTVSNEGTLPSHTVVGNRVKMHKSVVVQMTPSASVTLIEGLQKTVDSSPIEGHSQRSYQWIVKGKGSANILVMSPSFGSKSVNINVSAGGR